MGERMNIGIVGLGRMGSGIAKNLTQKAGSLCVHDPREDAMARLVEAGARACESPAYLAVQCNLVFLCLPYAPEVRDALFGARGIAGAGKDGLTVVDLTTLNRAAALDIAREAADAGLAYWDCPVSGMPFRAENGTLTVMFGGTDAAFERAKPYLECFGEFVVHCGPLGSGQAMKALNNIIYNVNIAALCEVLPLTVAVGLDPEQVERIVLSASARSFASEYFVPRMLEGRFDSDYAMQDAYKDIVNVRQMAAEKNARLPVVEAMVASYEAAMDAGFGAQPKSAMLKVYEEALGVRFRRRKG
jgi:3-hydroxyisobutyrate dehydrogenase-like beta-hydroxyacid dehydrogenase